MKKDLTAWLFIVVLLVLTIGWVLNLIDVVKYFLSDQRIVDISALMVGKIIGVPVTPLGGILGYF